MWTSFVNDVGCIFSSKICRLTKPPGTNRPDGKHQEHADICRNMQKSNASKNADIKSTTVNLQAAEGNQLQQAPSSKIGGGGARAARRIRIRRPRLAERGLRRVGFMDFCRLQSLRRTPPYPPTLAVKPTKTHLAAHQTPNVGFLADFLPIEDSSKIRLLKNPPKI